jgi:hypothetical protein
MNMSSRNIVHDNIIKSLNSGSNFGIYQYEQYSMDSASSSSTFNFCNEFLDKFNDSS